MFVFLVFVLTCLGDVQVGLLSTVEPNERLNRLWAFEFAPGGTLDMQLTLQHTIAADMANNPIAFLLCTDEQMAPLRRADVCRHFPNFEYSWVNCEWQKSMGSSYSMKERFSIVTRQQTSSQWYYLLSLNCQGMRFTVSVDYKAVNPGTEFLSLSEVPFKALYKATLVGWSILTALWVCNWWRYRWFNIALHRFLTLVPMLNAFASLSWLYYWRHKSMVGVEPVVAGWLCFGLTCLCRGLTFAAILLIGKGYRITKAQLTPAETRRIWLVSLMLVVAHGAYLRIGSFFLFLLIVLEVMVLRYVFMYIIDNSAALLDNLQLLRRMEVDHTITPVWPKMQIFKRFQVAVVVYISVDVMFTLWAAVFLRQTVPWFELAMDHVLTALCAIAVGMALRLRPFSPHSYRVLAHLEAPLDAPPPLAAAAMWRSGAQWRPGMGRPCVLDLKPDWHYNSEDLPILLIELPVPKDSTGKPMRVPEVVVAVPTAPTQASAPSAACPPVSPPFPFTNPNGRQEPLPDDLQPDPTRQGHVSGSGSDFEEGRNQNRIGYVAPAATTGFYTRM